MSDEGEPFWKFCADKQSVKKYLERHIMTEPRPPIRPRDDDWPEPRDYHRETAEEVKRLRMALRVAREAYSRPHLVYREATEDGMIVLRVTERVWRNALAAIDNALKGESHD